MRPVPLGDPGPVDGLAARPCNRVTDTDVLRKAGSLRKQMPKRHFIPAGANAVEQTSNGCAECEPVRRDFLQHKGCSEGLGHRSDVEKRLGCHAFGARCVHEAPHALEGDLILTQYTARHAEHWAVTKHLECEPIDDSARRWARLGAAGSRHDQERRHPDAVNAWIHWRHVT
jgi:hypothetical protein